MVKIEISKNNFISGVGTIICENYKDKPCIILAREKNKSEYLKKDQWEEFGGGVSNEKKSIPENASYELVEETANMIKIEKSKIEKVYETLIKPEKGINKVLKRYVDTRVPKKSSFLAPKGVERWVGAKAPMANSFAVSETSNNKEKDYYRCYFIRIDNLDLDIFYKNLDILKKNKETPDCYLEIDELTRIPIENFENFRFELIVNDGYYGGKEVYLIVKDIEGKDIRISQRTVKILLERCYNIDKNNKKLEYNGLDLCKILCQNKIENLKSSKKKVNKTNNFEKGTISYYI